MNQSTPVSLDRKVNFLIQKIQQIYHQISDKQNTNENIPTFKLRYMTFIDDSIQKIQMIYNNQKFNNLVQSGRKQEDRNNLTTRTDPNLAGYTSISEQYFGIEKEKLDLEKKLIQYRLMEVKKQQIQMEKQKQILFLQRQKKQIENINQKLSEKLQTVSQQIEYLKQKSKSQDKQLQRLMYINQKQNQQIFKVKQQRNKAQRQTLYLRQKLKQQQDQAIIPINAKPQKFNYKTTQGLKHIRLFTNFTNQKKNHQRFILLQLPVKMQVQKIVFAVRLGLVLSNKQVVYFSQLFLYEKDSMVISLEGDHLIVEYLKRKERVLLDKYKVNKPQILVMLYGKGDSVMIYEQMER